MEARTRLASGPPAERTSRWQRKGGRRWDTLSYPYGNDAQEVSREELEHDLWRFIWRRNFFAPVTAPARILDVASGTGIWGLQVLQEDFPEARLTDVDISPVVFKHFLSKPRGQQYKEVLDRVEFVQADVTQPFPFDTGTFDFTFARALDQFLSEEGWPRVIAEMRRVTQPDGYVEILAGSPIETEQPSDICAALVEAAVRLCQTINVAPMGGPGMDRYLQQAGITKYHRREYEAPNRKSPPEKILRARQLFTQDLKHIFASGRELIIQFGILPAEAFDTYLEQFEQEAMQKGLMMKITSVWFQPKDQPALETTS